MSLPDSHSIDYDIFVSFCQWSVPLYIVTGGFLLWKQTKGGEHHKSRRFGSTYASFFRVFLSRALILYFLSSMISYVFYVIISIVLCTQHTLAAVDEVSTAKNNSVEITKGINGLDKIILRQIHGSAVELYLYGAHVTSWKNDHGEELLLLSSKAIFSPPTAIRGGIPIIFPQFSNLGPLRSHGFARNRVWTIDTNPPPFPPKTINGVFVDLLLKPTQDDLNIWPNSFEFRLRVTLGIKGALTMTSRIKNTNTDNKPFNFTFAYHNYFRVSDISEVRVERLKSLDYLDNLQNRTRFTEEQDAVTFNAEVDRIYLSTPTKIPILDNKKKQKISVHKNGLPDAVVWNPWNKSIVDLGVDDYKSMVAVEASAIGKPVVLKAGEEWKASQRLSAVTSR